MITATIPLTLLGIAFLLTLVHAITSGKIPPWIPVLFIIIALVVPK